MSFVSHLSVLEISPVGVFLAQVLSVPGSCYPVEIIHSTEDHMEKYAESAVEVALDIHENQPPGILVLCYLTCCRWASAGLEVLTSIPSVSK